MRLRTFIAANMVEAIDQVRRELGSDAIIISNHVNSAGQTEVTAAVEHAPISRGDFITPKSEAPIATLPALEASLEQRLRDRLRSGQPNLTEVNAPPRHSGIGFDATLIADALDAQACPASLRDALVNAATALGHDDAVAALARALEVRLNFEPLATAPHAPVMLVGLPGSGKTVTMTKLAARAVMEGLDVDLISTDTARSGAAQQGQAYGELLDQKFLLADDADALALLLEENAASGNGLPDRTSRPCFIDTASVNPFDRVEWDTMQHFVRSASRVADAEPVLVLAATGDAGLMRETAAHFASLGARRLIATQVDIARRIGTVLGAADSARLSLAQISVTPYLAQGLSPMHPMICARLILKSRDIDRKPSQ